MRERCGRCVGLAGTVLIACAPIVFGAAVDIVPERIDFAVSEPLSSRALVTRPAPITGVLSWSLETRRHRGALWCLAVSPDGKRLATGGLDGTVRVWDVETGRLVQALIGHNSYVSGLDWSPDGNTLASAGTFDATVRLWGAESGRPLRVLRGHAAAASHVKWSPDGKSVLAAGGESGLLTSWSAAKGVKQGSLELGRPVLAMSWRLEGDMAAIVSQGLPLQVWDFEKNKVTRTLGETSDQFTTAAWGPDGKILAAGTAKNTILFDSMTGKPLRTLPSPSVALAWSRDGKLLATLYSDAVKIWDAETGQERKSVAVVGDHLLTPTPDLSRVITGSAASFSVLDTSAGKVARRFDNLSGTLPPLWWYRKTVVSGVGTSKLTLWDLETGKKLHALEGHTAAITAVAVPPGGKTLATASYDKTIRIWDTASGKQTQIFTGHAAPVVALDVTSDGKLIASSSSDKQVIVWETASASARHTLADHAKNVTALVWKPGSTTSLLLDGSDTGVRVVNVRTDKVEKAIDAAHEVVSLAWSPDGGRIAIGLYNSLVQIGHVGSGKTLHRLESPGSPPQVSSLAWSPSGSVVASGRGNHTMQLWDPKTGKNLFSVPTMAPVQRVSWSAGSSIVGVSSHDRTLRFIDAGTGKLRALAVAEDDQLLLASADGHFRAPDPGAELVHVVLTRTSQETLTHAQFTTKYKFKNVPAKVNLFGK